MFQRLKALLQRSHELAEIEKLTQHDLDDLGMTRDQLRAFARMPTDVPGRVQAMAAIFGLSEDDLKHNHAQWLELQQCCGHCQDRAACALVLERGELSRPRDAAFCPNAAEFAQMAETKAHAA